MVIREDITSTRWPRTTFRNEDAFHVLEVMIPRICSSREKGVKSQGTLGTLGVAREPIVIVEEDSLTNRRARE